MASGLSPKLPLTLDYTDGYTLNKTYAEMVTQNLKMLILTAPGERVMDPDYGVGIRNFLFEPNISLTHLDIVTRTKSQVRKYMPFLDIQTIIATPDDDETMDPNEIHLQIKYYIRPLQLLDVLNLTFENTT